MGILHRKHGHDAETPDAGTARATSGADYDAAADLALPAAADTHAEDAFVPFAGELAPEPAGPGYDLERDTGIIPG